MYERRWMRALVERGSCMIVGLEECGTPLLLRVGGWDPIEDVLRKNIGDASIAVDVPYTMSENLPPFDNHV
ncbi:hypothetical protein V6N13_123779 [Hibiscus sabdariffa]